MFGTAIAAKLISSLMAMLLTLNSLVPGVVQLQKQQILADVPVVTNLERNADQILLNDIEILPKRDFDVKAEMPRLKQSLAFRPSDKQNFFRETRFSDLDRADRGGFRNKAIFKASVPKVTRYLLTPAEITKLRSGRDLSHIISNKNGGPVSPSNTVFEDSSLNRSRGARNMTKVEVAKARFNHALRLVRLVPEGVQSRSKAAFGEISNKLRVAVEQGHSASWAQTFSREALKLNLRAGAAFALADVAIVGLADGIDLLQGDITLAQAKAHLQSHLKATVIGTVVALPVVAWVSAAAPAAALGLAVTGSVVFVGHAVTTLVHALA